jgi:3-hydroxybutyryl-CoA dehydrogenase
VLDRIGVVGAGTAGRGIARAFAATGVEVCLVETTPDRLSTVLEQLRESLDRDIARWGLTEAERDAILARIQGVTRLSAVANCPLVVEAIHEDFAAKQRLLIELDQLCPDDTIFFSSTSTLSLTDLARALPSRRRSRMVGVHFQHPVPRVPIVELVRGRETSAETLAMAREVAQRLDRQVVEVAEYPGYVTTRVTLALINEAVHTLMEGVATRDAIDQALKLRLGSTIGPLALADEMGLDSVVRALESLWSELGLPQYRPCPLLRQMVRRGHLGEKSGRGFYRYDDEGRRLMPDEPDFGLPGFAALPDEPGLR